MQTSVFLSFHFVFFFIFFLLSSSSSSTAPPLFFLLLQFLFWFLVCRDLTNISLFSYLETLILDKNELTDLSLCPSIPTLRTLWFNNNNVNDLPAFMDEVVAKFPSLQYLSVMRNPACPGLMNITDPDVEAIRLYRMYIIFRLPQLLVLDCTAVTPQVNLSMLLLLPP